jgi:ketosteroid isomerase-like protein
MKTPVRTSSVLALLALVAPALAAEQNAGQGDPMASWKPPKVRSEQKDKREILAVFAKMEAAEKKGDLEAAAAAVDFPVLMVTDDSKGEAQAASWTKEQWTQVMKPFYEKPMDAKMTHKPSIFMVTDSLATATDSWTMTMGGKTTSGRNSTVFIRRGGEWKIKSMMEGGWGDMPMPGLEKAGSGGK